jgi:rSAM/selenodomain-associated transferase 2
VRLSVVIPALDEAERIAGAVASARAPDVEVIVVDGGSSDATRALAGAAGAHVIRCGRGRARQLDAGARAACGDALLFLHADTRLPQGYADAALRALSDARVAGGAFRLRFEERTRGLRWIERIARLRVRLFGLPYGDQALFLRRETLEAIGGVPQVPILEDLDLVRALKRRGRLALLREEAVTSARRHLAGGPWRIALRHLAIALGGSLGVDRARLAAWARR